MIKNENLIMVIRIDANINFFPFNLEQKNKRK